MMKLRHREVERLTQGHPASKQQTQGLDAGSMSSQSCKLAALYYITSRKLQCPMGAGLQISHHRNTYLTADWRKR